MAITSVSGADPRAWDRFATWPRGLARLALLAVLLAVIAAALVPIHARIRPHKRVQLASCLPLPSMRAPQARGNPGRVRDRPWIASPPRTDDGSVTRAGGNASVCPPGATVAKPNPRGRDTDLMLYDRVIARMERGEPYYPTVIADQRRSHYPVTPGFAVRLPTLALIEAQVGVIGEWVLAVLLFAAVLLAWWRRLGEEPGGRAHRLPAMILLACLAARGLYGYYFVVHEVWAGMLLALAFGLHRPAQRRWGVALAVAALALAIRELALPFVLLMAAMAAWRRDWREAGAWTALIAIFVAAMAAHLQTVASLTLPGDVPSAPWLALRGLSGWLSNAVLASNLRYIDHHLSGVLIVLAMLGWAGWRSPAGRFGFWFYGGYGLAFMIAGRWENFYWGWMIGPAQLIGLAFAPRALASLVEAGFPGSLARVRPLLHKLPRWLRIRPRYS